MATSLKSALQASLDVTEYIKGFSVIKRSQVSESNGRPHDSKRIIQIGRLVVAGRSIKQIVAETGANRNYIARWAKRLKLVPVRDSCKGGLPKGYKFLKPRVYKEIPLGFVHNYDLQGWKKGGPWAVRQQPEVLDPQWLREHSGAVQGALKRVAVDYTKGRFC